MPPLTRHQQAVRLRSTAIPASQLPVAYNPENIFQGQAICFPDTLQSATFQQNNPYSTSIGQSHDSPIEANPLINLGSRRLIQSDLDPFGRSSNISNGSNTPDILSVPNATTSRPVWTSASDWTPPTMHGIYHTTQPGMTSQTNSYDEIKSTQQRNAEASVQFMNPFDSFNPQGPQHLERAWKYPSIAQGNMNHTTLSTISMSSSIDSLTAVNEGDKVAANQSPARVPFRASELQSPLSIEGPEGLYRVSSSSLSQPRDFKEKGKEQNLSFTTVHSTLNLGDIQMRRTHDGLLKLITTARSHNDEGGMRAISQASSIGSNSPSSRSSISTAYLMSPQTPFSSSKRFAGDSSIETSVESISDSVNSISAEVSRSSSTSDGCNSSIGNFSSASSRQLIKGKTKLRNIDRKLICEAARANPTTRQEDIAKHFGVERSTVSKTLKNKDKWLNINEEGVSAMIVKHRAGKFPQIEEALKIWAKKELIKSEVLHDVTIKEHALELALRFGLSTDAFKASVGWIEKFRERSGLPKQSSVSRPNATSEIENADKEKKVVKPTLVRRSSDRIQNANDLRLGETSLESVEEEEEEEEEDNIETIDGITIRLSRTQPSASSESTENPLYAADRATPKSSKRQHADMINADSSIHDEMAKMHAKQGSLKEYSLVKERREDKDDESSQTRRKRSQTEAAKAPTPKKKRGRSPTTGKGKRSSRKSRGDDALVHPFSDTNAVSTADEKREQHQSDQDFTNWQEQGNRTVNNPLFSLQRSTSDYGMMTKIQPNQSTPMNRIASSPATSLQRTSVQKGLSQRPSFINEEGEGGIQDSYSSQSPNGQVTLEEAKASLDVVLSFLKRLGTNLNPSEFFALSKLQETLGSLAAQNEDQAQFQSMQPPM